MQHRKHVGLRDLDGIAWEMFFRHSKRLSMNEWRSWSQESLFFNVSSKSLCENNRDGFRRITSRWWWLRSFVIQAVAKLHDFTTDCSHLCLMMKSSRWCQSQRFSNYYHLDLCELIASLPRDYMGNKIHEDLIKQLCDMNKWFGMWIIYQSMICWDFLKWICQSGQLFSTYSHWTLFCCHLLDLDTFTLWLFLLMLAIEWSRFNRLTIGRWSIHTSCIRTFLKLFETNELDI
jgi:hypothetical protein